jgi:aminopeptidase N
VPVGKKEQGTFGLDVAVKSLPLLEDYFGQKYPLPKLDLVAIADFAFGAVRRLKHANSLDGKLGFGYV